MQFLRSLQFQFRASIASSRALIVNKTFSTKTFKITQGGNLFFDFNNISVSNIILCTAWQDHVDINVVDSKSHCDVKFEENVVDNLLVISDSEQNTLQQSKIDIAVTCPELCNITINARQLSLNVRNKLHGDVNVTCAGGTISLDKIRGHKLNFNCGNTDIVIHKLIEGNINVQRCKNFNSKLVNGDIINVECTERIKVGAVYSKNATFCSKSSIEIDSTHGVCKLQNSNEDIKVNSLDGSCDILSESGNIFIHINKIDHNSNSTLVSKKGNTNVNIDAAVNTKFLLKSKAKELKIISNLFLHELMDDNYVVGYHLQDLADKNSNDKGSGKINLSSAYKQSLYTFINDSVKDGKNITSSIASSISINSYGSIQLETISWMDNIKKKYGLIK